MGRRKSGQAITGWLVLDKPAGMNSTAAVGKIRWAFDAKKAGHAGTLDPAATGLLAIALGEATKCVADLADALKTYRFGVRFGAATDTDDAEGEIIAESPKRPTDGEIEAALDAFRGQIMQVPPQYSAVRVDGARAYDRARDGEVMDLEARALHVARLDRVERVSADEAIFEMVCGKGGYVRSIARDLGQALGTFGHVSWLRRTQSGPFTLSDAVSVETVETEARSPALGARLLPLERGLEGLPEARVNEAHLGPLACGNPVPAIAPNTEWGDRAWASHKGKALALGHVRGGTFHPNRVFVR
ncbi:MAG: tRNA pseudouridine(55) synthase TruB [Pseudomonadota bacterium]